MPCPRCLVKKTDLNLLGTENDMSNRTGKLRKDDDQRRAKVSSARRIIYELQYAIDSKHVENILKEQSYIPTTVRKPSSNCTVTLKEHTQNAFSRLHPFGFDLFRIILPDLMHEVELGTWKSLFIHLLRILDCLGENLKHELDRR
jgi:hypothetical protein